MFSSSPASSRERLRSIDVFRGATIAGMILVNGQFSREDAYPQLAHASWNGWTFADIIFPFFLFIVGVSITLSTAARVERGEDHVRLLGHAVGRSLLIFACGVFIELLHFPSPKFPFIAFHDHLQLTGVLQKIAVCYLLAFLILLWAGRRGVILGIVGLNLMYLGLLFFYPVPGCGAGVLTMSCNFPGYLDGIVLGSYRWNDAAQDPDGLGAILPAITTVLFGVLAGQVLRTSERPGRRLLGLFGGGIALAAAATLLARWIPINKPLWSSSYAVLMAGLAAICLAGCSWLVDVQHTGRWFRPLQIFGVNAVAAYLISRLAANVPRVHVMGKSLYADVLRHLASPPNASLMFAMVVLLGVYGVVWLMDRRGWYLKF
jgi:predicted acyltransferase